MTTNYAMKVLYEIFIFFSIACYASVLYIFGSIFLIVEIKVKREFSSGIFHPERWVS